MFALSLAVARPGADAVRSRDCYAPPPNDPSTPHHHLRIRSPAALRTASTGTATLTASRKHAGSPMVPLFCWLRNPRIHIPAHVPMCRRASSSLVWPRVQGAARPSCTSRRYLQVFRLTPLQRSGTSHAHLREIRMPRGRAAGWRGAPTRPPPAARPRETPR